MNRFTMPVDIRFGDNALSVLKRYTFPFIVADSFFKESAHLKKIQQMFSQNILFTDFTPDPTLEEVAHGITVFRAHTFDCVIALGGGSAIDTAKAILYFNQHDQNAPSTPFIAIPTTSGTGSEVTAFSVVTDGEKGVKYPLISEKMCPDIAILDVSFTETVPPRVAADTGADVLCHALESYVSALASPFSDALCEKAMLILFQNLEKGINGDRTAKEQVHFASCLAGMAFNASNLGLCHALAHNVGARLHIPHGRANAILLPHVIAYNAGGADFFPGSSAVRAKYAFLSQLIGNEGPDSILVRKLISDIRGLFRKIGLPKSFTDAGVDPKLCNALINDIIDGALADGCMQTNPVTIDKSALEVLFKGAM